MCIVIDLNAISAVFTESNNNHENFKHVKNWIFAGKGFLVYGGSKYKSELQKAFRYLRLIRQLKDSGKAIAIKDFEVDKKENLINSKLKNTDCDDPHIIALLLTSRCPILCTLDARSHKHVKNRSLYPKGMKRVKIYSSLRHKALLSRKVSAGILKHVAN